MLERHGNLDDLHAILVALLLALALVRAVAVAAVDGRHDGVCSDTDDDERWTILQQQTEEDEDEEEAQKNGESDGWMDY